MPRTIYALKGNADWLDVTPDLARGEGRFGWSYAPTGDLRSLRERIETQGWDTLSDDEKDCYAGQQFLLELDAGDHVVYVNLPKWGQCTLARVTGPYEFRYDADDFNHRFPVDPASVRTFDRNDECVHPSLSARLKLQRRWWTIGEYEAFRELQEALELTETDRGQLPRSNTEFLHRDIRPYLADIAQQIHRSHPAKELEPLIAEVFRRMPSVTSAEVKSGRADKGADVVVRFESGLPVPGLQNEQVLLIQAKSYEGDHADTAGIEALEDAFEVYGADMALLISTARTIAPEVEQAAEQRSNQLGKPIRILNGPDFARLVLAWMAQS